MTSAWLIILLTGVVIPVLSFRLICYYDSSSHSRTGSAKMVSLDIVPSLNYCTHIIYGYADIHEFYSNVISTNEQLDVGKGYYRILTSLKNRFPGLHVILSVGGPGNSSTFGKYLNLLKNEEDRLNFIDSAYKLVKQYDFDGIDLSWRFPETEAEGDHGKFGKIWYKIKKAFGFVEIYNDDEEEVHRNGFTELVKDLGSLLQNEGYLLSVTVLPNTRTTIYYDVSAIEPYLNILNLMAFDFKTPWRNPEKADYPAPLYSAGDRNPNESVDGMVQWWLENGMPGKKISIGVPTYGRTWKLTDGSSTDGVPPVDVDGAGANGTETKTPGLLSYAEICNKILPNAANNKGKMLKRVVDPCHELGTYAYKLPSSDDSEDGLWVGFDDEDSVRRKSNYVTENKFGGIAIYDLSFDDFKGTCTGKQFPLTAAAKEPLKIYINGKTK